MNKKLYRVKKNQLLGGVCTGLAEYFSIDVVIVRIILICLIFINFAGFFLYILLWIMIPYSTEINSIETQTQTQTQIPNDENNFNYNKDESAQNLPVCSKDPNRRTFLGGALLIALGIAFLLDEWLDFLDSEFFWPALLILIGLALIINSRRTVIKED